MASSSRARARTSPPAPPRARLALPRPGLADGIGLVMALTLLGYVAPFRDPINLPRMAILWVGAAVLLPFLIRRWRSLPGRRSIAVPAGAAVGLLAWGALSALLAGGPWGVSLYGWWGRSDGLLTLAGVTILLLAGATLAKPEIQRLLLWLLVALGCLGLVGLGQWLGVVDWGQVDWVDALLGNPNIAAGLCAIGAVVLGYAVADSTVGRPVRIARGAVAVLLVLVAIVNGSAQGPATVALGALAGAGFLGLALRGRARALVLGAVAGAGLLVVVVTALAVAGAGPLAPLWSDFNTQVRIAAWGAGIDVMATRPAFGTGPGGMERFYFEFAPADYVAFVGPQVPVSALHNLALQFGATLGVPALILWLTVFVGAAVAVGMAAWRHWVSPALAGALGGGLVAYLVQGMVSIDMVALMALGWLVAGLCLAAARPDDMAQQGEQSRPGYMIASVTLGMIAALAIVPQVRAIPPGGAALDATEATAILRNPLTPCHIRVDIAVQAGGQLAADVGPPAVYDAWRLDPRCLTMAHVAAQTAMSQGQLEVAAEASAQAVTQDPTFVTSWTLRARYHALSGDIDAALADLVRAREEQQRYPDPSAYEAEIAELEQAIASLG